MFTIIGGDGKEYGPVSVEQMREWLASGRASLDSQAKQTGYEQWKRLGDFDEFAPQGSSAPPPVKGESPVPATTAVANRWLRLLAATIDGMINFLCMLPTLIPMWRAAFEQISSGQVNFQAMVALGKEFNDRSMPYLITLMLVQGCLLTLRGQSIGKLTTGLRIIRFSTEAKADFVHVFLLRGTVPWLIGKIPVVGTLFWIVDCCFIFRDDSRCLHDLMADTKVVKK